MCPHLSSNVPDSSTRDIWQWLKVARNVLEFCWYNISITCHKILGRCARPGLIPGPLNLEASMLTITPRRWPDSLQTYDIAQNYRNLHTAVQRCHNITSKYQTTAIFKRSVKANDDSNKTCRHVHDLSLCTKLHMSKHNGSRVLSIKWNVYLNFQPPTMFIFFLVFHKSVITKTCLSFEDLSAYKIIWSYIDWCKFCIHLRILNVTFFNGCSYGIKNYGVEVTFNGMTSLLNVIKIYQLVQKFKGWEEWERNNMVIPLADIFPLGRK
jgi:hypothetical protein